MSGLRYTEEFKRDAVTQVTDRGYSVREVAARLGISTKSLYDSDCVKTQDLDQAP